MLMPPSKEKQQNDIRRAGAHREKSRLPPIEFNFQRCFRNRSFLLHEIPVRAAVGIGKIFLSG